MRNVGVISELYELPFGRGQPFANGLQGWRNGLASGWSVASVVMLQAGFPFTPQLSYNPTNNGDTRNPVRPFVNPDFTGSVILGAPEKWFNPSAFIAPPPTGGFYGITSTSTTSRQVQFGLKLLW